MKRIKFRSHKKNLTEYEGYNLISQLSNSLRGGEAKDPAANKQLLSISKQRIKTTVIAALGIILAQQLISHYKHHIPTKDEIQSYVLQLVSKIHQKGNIGMAYYVLLLALSEFVGLTTMVVEIAGGMVYGFSTGFRLNAIGKVSGAMITYAVGRTLLYSKIKSQILQHSTATSSSAKQTSDKNSKIGIILGLISNSIHHKTFAHSLLLRFSILPQVIKNYTLSVMDPVKWWIFLFVTCLHVLPYTLLWSAVGHDSTLRLQEITGPNVILNAVLLFVTIFGFVGVPALTAWWIQQMRLLAEEEG